MEEVGKITESTTSSFIFRAEKEMRKHDYVKVGEVLAQVWEIKQQSNGIFAYAHIIGSESKRYWQPCLCRYYYLTFIYFGYCTDNSNSWHCRDGK